MRVLSLYDLAGAGRAGGESGGVVVKILIYFVNSHLCNTAGARNFREQPCALQAKFSDKSR